MDAAAARHPDVPYEPQLIDATFALLISSSGAPMVIPALNRDGDILSDLVLPLFGSIAGSESLLVAFGDDVSTADGADGGGRARDRAGARGQGRREPDGDDPRRRPRSSRHATTRSAQHAGRAIREATLEAVAEGIRTADLGGHHGTTAFTDEVIRRDAGRSSRSGPRSRTTLGRERPRADAISPASNASRKAARRGSNCVPAQRSISASASSGESDGR